MSEENPGKGIVTKWSHRMCIHAGAEGITGKEGVGERGVGRSRVRG